MGHTATCGEGHVPQSSETRCLNTESGRLPRPTRNGQKSNLLSFSIMVTTTGRTFILPQTARLSPWQRFKRYISFRWIKCCLGEKEYECAVVDEQVRSSLREQMRKHTGYTNVFDDIEHVMNEVVINDNYDLGDVGRMRHAVDKQLLDADGLKAYYYQVAQTPSQSHELVVGPVSEGTPWRPEPSYSVVGDSAQVKIIPKFAAACAIHLRARLGVLTKDQTNILLVQREYLRVCKLRHVRSVDVVLHQQHVINAFFGETPLDEVGNTRKRLPAWLKALAGMETAQVPSPAPC